jgi:hypothetical protein
MARQDRPQGVWDPELDYCAHYDTAPPVSGAAWEFGDGKPSGSKGEASKLLNRIGALLSSPRFHVVAGIAGPFVCLGLDPFIFQGGDEHGPAFGSYWLIAYCFIGLEILVLSLWLRAPERLGPVCGAVAGALLAGSVVACGLGLVLLPFSLLGALAVIGLLGFTPFFTSIVFFYNGILALRVARASSPRWFLAPSVVLGAAVVLALPCLIWSGVHSGWRAAIRDLADGDESAMKRVRFFYPLLDREGDHYPVETAIENEHVPVRKQRLIDGNRSLGL